MVDRAVVAHAELDCSWDITHEKETKIIIYLNEYIGIYIGTQ